MNPPDPITKAMQLAVETGVFPGAVLLVRVGGRLRYQGAFGHASLIPEPVPVSLETVYDLASLTKPLATTTAVLCLAQEGRLGLDESIGAVLGELKGTAIGEATVAHLLHHSSGLPGWRPFYERIAERDLAQPGFLGSAEARQFVMALIGQEALLAPIGTRSLYSDLGFMLLGLIVERRAGCSLAGFVRDHVYATLQAEPLFFIRTGRDKREASEGLPVDLHRVASTEEDTWRGRVVRAEVHDENAYAMGGVAGHSGLFGTAEAVLAVSGCWLNGYLGRDSLFRSDWVRRFTSRQDQPSGSSWGLGWDTPSPPSSSGTKFSPQSFGHLGYTGTSLWVDPRCELEVVLLSNRVHPTRKNDKIREFRPKIHDIIYEGLIADS